MCAHTQQILIVRSSGSKKVPTNTELANPESLPVGKLQSWVPVSLSGHIFINQSMHNLALGAFLFKNAYLLRPAASQLVPEQSLSITAFLCLGTRDST